MTTAERIARIRTALADPDAPWYGSDLVPLVADVIEDYERLQQHAAEQLEIKRLRVDPSLPQ